VGIQVWGSNPAFLWTSKRPEAEGVHVHAFRKLGDKPDLDETYGQVSIDGVHLDPVMVRVLMAQSAMPSLANRVVSIGCPSCGSPEFGIGELAFTPTVARTCKKCGRAFSVSGRLRKVISNPLPGVLLQLARGAPREPQHHDLGLLPETL